MSASDDDKTRKALSAIDTMAMIWAAEVELHAIVDSILAEPVSKQHDKFYSMLELAFGEGAYRHYSDARDGKVPNMTYSRDLEIPK